jgi:hypothetical protein
MGILRPKQMRLASSITRSAAPTTATLSIPEPVANTPTGRRQNKFPEESEGGSSRNGSVRSRSNSILNYDKDSNLLRRRPLLPRYQKRSRWAVGTRFWISCVGSYRPSPVPRAWSRHPLKPWRWRRASPWRWDHGPLPAVCCCISQSVIAISTIFFHSKASW